MNDNVERQRQHFESISHEYFQQRQHPNHLRLKQLLWRAYFERHKNILPRGGTVLEAMCGHGEGKSILSEHLHPEFTYRGFDYSESMVQFARSIHGDVIEVQDITHWQPQEQHDLVILIGGLHHVFQQTEDIMKRLYAALKPGGYFISMEPTHDNVIWGKVREHIYKKNHIFDAESEQGYDLRDLNRYYAQAGFEIVEQLHVGLLAYILYYNPDAFPMLNVGSPRIVELLVALEKPFYRTWLARKISFGTFTLLRRPLAH